jgi:hypothetical protein
MEMKNSITIRALPEEAQSFKKTENINRNEIELKWWVDCLTCVSSQELLVKSFWHWNTFYIDFLSELLYCINAHGSNNAHPSETGQPSFYY